MTSSRASQLKSKKLPPGPVVRMVVSAGRLFLWQAWDLARAAGHILRQYQQIIFNFIKEDVITGSVKRILRMSFGTLWHCFSGYNTYLLI